MIGLYFSLAAMNTFSRANETEAFYILLASVIDNEPMARDQASPQSQKFRMAPLILLIFCITEGLSANAGEFGEIRLRALRTVSYS